MTDRTDPRDDLASAALTGWRAFLRDFAQMVRFYSRLPVPRLPFEADAHAMPDFRTAPRMLPLAACVISLPALLVLALLSLTTIPPLALAAVVIAVSAFSTGAFHEDGLADTFDGLGGGVTPERRLEIMKDSRIGAFGGTALMLGLILRVVLLGGVIEQAGAGVALAVVVAVAAVSRSIALLPLVMLPPARPDGFTAAVGRPSSGTFVRAVGLSLFLAGATAGAAGLTVWSMALGAGLGAFLTLGITYWSLRTIQGQTGDIAGACQQLAEIGFYLGVLILLGKA